MILWSRFRELITQVPLFGRVLKLIWDAAPRWSMAWLILLVVQGLLPVVLVCVIRVVIDGLARMLPGGGHQASLQPLLVPLVLLVGVMILMAGVRSLLHIIRSSQSELVQERISALIQTQSTAIDFACYESSEYYDKLFRARNDASYRPMELVESMGSLLQNSITMVAMAAVLLPYGIWAPAALVFSTMPVLYIVFDHRLRQYRWRRDNTLNERRSWYWDWLVSSREHAAELRIFDLGKHFMSFFQRIREMLRRDSLAMQQRQAAAELLATLFALLVTGAAMGWMLLRVVAGTATLGDLALFYQAINQGQQLMRSLLENIGQMYSSSLFLADFFEYLALEPAVVSPANPLPLPRRLRQGIRFDQVCFRYPDTDRYVLEEFSLDIPAGQITAIVGKNGTGKSTLVKLLSRLYDPEAGRITMDGVDLRRVALSELRARTTTLFQEPVRYCLNVAENIRLGDLTVPPGDPRIMQAARFAGVEEVIERLPKGEQTMLGRWFPDSVDLSGGEWQRLALARAFLRDSQLIILDEPTSAMDSWAESEWLSRCRQLVGDRTVLIITHRFTTAMQADVIHVMDQGRVVESGTHGELLALQGRYASSWDRQMRGRLRQMPAAEE